MVRLKNIKTLIALVPVLHTSYLDLFKKYPDEIYVIGDSILREWEYYDRLQRDLRKLDQETIARLIKKSGLVSSVKILEKNDISELAEKNIVMPNEDVSRWFSGRFLKNREVCFEDIFLRWNREISLKEREVVEDRQHTIDDFHREFISRALELSQRSANWWRQIGAVAVKGGGVISAAYNEHVPTQINIDVYGDLRSDFNAGENHELSNSIHAEAALVALSAKKGVSLDGADLYVTTFPCPTCAKLIAAAGIKRVFYKSGYSLADAEDVLKAFKIKIILVK